jgi:hypothetical protein
VDTSFGAVDKAEISLVTASISLDSFLLGGGFVAFIDDAILDAAPGIGSQSLNRSVGVGGFPQSSFASIGSSPQFDIFKLTAN